MSYPWGTHHLGEKSNTSVNLSIDLNSLPTIALDSPIHPIPLLLLNPINSNVNHNPLLERALDSLAPSTNSSSFRLGIPLNIKPITIPQFSPVDLLYYLYSLLYPNNILVNISI